MTDSSTPISDLITRFTGESTYDDLKPEVREDARKSLLDTIGVALAGSAEKASRILVAASGVHRAPGPATVLGTAYGTTPLLAALANGYAAHTLDYDDTQHRLSGHMSAPVVGAALAMAEAKKRSGADLLTAYIVGFEVACRLGRASEFARHLSKTGIHSTGFLGRFGAVAAVSRLAGLSTAQTDQAFGVVANQVSGLVRSFGTMGKAYNAGNAAHDAVLSTLLAGEGFTGPASVFDGAQSIFAICDAETDPDQIADGLGEEYEITHNTLKAFACAGWRNPIIEAGIALRAAHDIRPDNVDSIVVSAWEGVSHLPNYAEPTIGLESKFSAQYAAAVSLADGAGGVRQFSDERVADPVLAALTRRAELHFDPDLARYQIRLEVTTTDGQQLSHFVPVQKGDHENPLGWDELEVKFRANAVLALPDGQVDELLTMLRDVEAVTDASEIVRACRLPS